MRSIHVFFIVGIIIAALVGSCKKKDEQPPSININSPLSGQTFSALDTILVTGNVADNEEVTSVSINLLNEDQIPVCDDVSYKVNTNKYSIYSKFVINNIYLESGTYYLQIVANDKENTARSHLSLYVASIPKERLGLFVVSNNSEANYDVHYIDNDGDEEMFVNVSSSFQDSEVNNYSQQLSVLSNEGFVSVYDVVYNEVVWEISGISNVLHPYIGRTAIIENYLWIGYGNGSLKAFDEEGNVRKSASMTDINYQPSVFIKHENYLIVESRPNNNNKNRIEKIGYVSGVALSYREIDMDISKIFSVDEEKVIMWGNEDNVVSACTLSVVYDIIYSVGNNLPQEELKSVIQIDQNTYLLGIGNSVYSFNLISGNASVYLDGVTPDQLYFDEMNSQVFIVDGSLLYSNEYPSQEMLSIYNNGNSIESIIMHYNK